MSETRDYYEVLGVDRDADQQTIKRAFLKKAREVHPDVSDDPDAEQKFKEVNEAYSVLSDEEKRANYDRYGTAEGMGDYVDFSDFDDLFSQFFGGSGRGRSGGRKASRKGRDMAINLTITLQEAALGCEKTISYDRLAPCDDCNGTGREPGAQERTCPRCNGTGYVTQVQRTFLGQVQQSSPCPECGGEGTVIDHPCETCDGQGRVPTHEKIDIDVPAGVRTGRQLRISGYGEAGYRGASSGDLIVNVLVEEDERFERDGDDLIADVHVSISQAALGCTVETDGIKPDEVIKVEVPAGTQYGSIVTVTNRGMPRIGGGGSRGNFKARIIVDVPKHLSHEARELLEQYAEEMGEDAGKGKRKHVGDRIRDAIDDIRD